jgi:hypothetical protein
MQTGRFYFPLIAESPCGFSDSVPPDFAQSPVNNINHLLVPSPTITYL